MHYFCFFKKPDQSPSGSTMSSNITPAAPHSVWKIGVSIRYLPLVLMNGEYSEKMVASSSIERYLSSLLMSMSSPAMDRSAKP